MKKTALILSNGVPPGMELMKRMWQEVNLKVCADGGANFAVSQGFIPDVVVGDMDSILLEVRQKLEIERIVEITEQNTNDSDKALRYCLNQGVHEVHLLGAAGERSDQFLANIELLYKYASEMKITLWTEQDRIELIEGTWQENMAPGTTLSLLPLFGPVEEITTSGLAFPLQNQKLEMGKEPSGISNKTITPSVQISMGKGTLLLIIQSVQ
ncbi:MAG: thiamine diphosphokinase [SAR324 cluster bacterium]|nr:thiamine diphosphokinase [SAR324 cluster bacterium]